MSGKKGNNNSVDLQIGTAGRDLSQLKLVKSSLLNQLIEGNANV
jgi:hypothetical protein